MKTPIFLTLFSLLAGVVLAQKLPQKQTTGVWAPQNLKIDGLPDEWGTFQAYNKATNIFYTLSNDDKNLYLVVQAIDPVIIDKITTSGITFTVEKKDDDQSVTFPAYDKENQAIFYIMMNAPKANSTDKLAALHIDTFIRSHNELRDKRQKIIRLAHNDEESNISVFNDVGIRVSGRINRNLSYTQELAILLKYLGINPGDTFNYEVQLNGQVPKNAKVISPRPGYISWVDVDGQVYGIGSSTPENLTLAYPTNFKAKYTLATK